MALSSYRPKTEDDKHVPVKPALPVRTLRLSLMLLLWAGNCERPSIVLAQSSEQKVGKKAPLTLPESPERPDNDMLAAQIAGLPSGWNCKHSGETSLGHSRKILNWEFLGRAPLVFAFFLWDSSANSVSCDHGPVPRENYMRNRGEQMLNIPLHTVNCGQQSTMIITYLPFLSHSNKPHTQLNIPPNIPLIAGSWKAPGPFSELLSSYTDTETPLSLSTLPLAKASHQITCYVQPQQHRSYSLGAHMLGPE
ncbi:hypothetical protein NQZ68_001623 [Dissostichus eleginoides]|nr:hypothetical protein NQZ68_001623 [Dissostichus eleginoides]